MNVSMNYPSTLRCLLRRSIPLVCLWMLVCSCQATQHAALKKDDRVETVPETVQRTPRSNPRAVHHFMNGLIYTMANDHANAILEFQSAQRYESKDPIIYESLGDAYLRRQDGNLALQMYNQAFRLNPANKKVAYILVNYFQNMRPPRFDQAELVLEKYAAAQPGPPRLRVLLDLIELNIYNGHIDIALERSRYIMPGADLMSVFRIMDALMQAKQIDAGIELFEWAHLERPYEGDILFVLGDLYKEKGDTLRSLQMYENARDVDSLTAYLPIRLVETYLSLDKIEKAVALFDQVDYGTQKKIGLWYADHDAFNKAEKIFEDLHVSYEGQPPEIIDILYHRTLMARALNKFDESLEYITSAISYDSTEALLYLHQSISYDLLHRSEEAVHAVDRALAQKNAAELLYRLYRHKADLLSKQGIFHDAEEYYLKALAEITSRETQDSYTSVNKDIILNNYSYLLAEQGVKLHEALHMSLQAVKSQPQNQSYLDTLGWIYFKLGEVDSALVYLHLANETGESNAVILEHLGDAYLKKGNIRKALEFWNLAHALDKSNEIVLQKLEQYRLKE